VIQLPENESIKIFAITVADNPYDHLKLTSPLYDDFSNRPGMALNLPKSYVSENMNPMVRIEFDAQKELGSFPAKLTMKDYADMHQPNGVLASYSYDTLTGWTDPVRIGSINDGMFDLLPDDSIRDKWTSVGQGRIIMDLQREIEIDSLHVFGVQNLKRGSRSFSIWMSPAENPEIKGDPGASGWKFVAYAKPEELLGNGKTLYRIFPLEDQKVECRHIMFVSEDSPHGPYYFHEIDVFEKQN
jgi:hypothetical protein